MVKDCKHKWGKVPAERYSNRSRELKDVYPYGAIICAKCGYTYSAREGETDKYKDILDIWTKTDKIDYRSPWHGAAPELQKGDRYNMLTVIAYRGVNRYGRRLVECSCDCGGKITTLAYAVRSGRTRSCGCLRGKRG